MMIHHWSISIWWLINKSASVTTWVNDNSFKCKSLVKVYRKQCIMHWKLKQHHLSITAFKFTTNFTVCSTACVDKYKKNNNEKTSKHHPIDSLWGGAHRCPMDCPHKGPTMRNISLALIGQCNAFKTRQSLLLIIYDDIYIMLNGCNSACQHRLCIMVISLHARPGIYIHQQFYCLFNSVWANIPQNIKAPHYWSFVRGVNGARRIPRTQGQQGAKRNIYKTLQQIWTKYSLDLTVVKYSTIFDTAH